MTTAHPRRFAALAIAVLTATVVAACGSSSPTTAPASPPPRTGHPAAAPGQRLAAAQQARDDLGRRPPARRHRRTAVDALNAQVAEFEAKYPDITVEPEEYNWTGADVHRGARRRHAAGRVHDPVHRRQGRSSPSGQIVDIDDRVQALPTPTSSTRTSWSTARTPTARSTACRSPAYGMGLHYNRDAVHAGRARPDKPPTTWDEVRADAKAIADKTGQAGYAEMARRQHRWLAAHDRRDLRASAAGWRRRRGRQGHRDRQQPGRPRQPSSSSRPCAGTTTRMGSNFLLRLGHHQPGVRRRPDRHVHRRLGRLHRAGRRTTSIKPEDYGLTAIPLGDRPDAGVLGGGTLAAVNVKAPPTPSATRPSSGSTSTTCRSCWTRTPPSPMPRPSRPTASRSAPRRCRSSTRPPTTQSQAWIKDYINVPPDQMTASPTASSTSRSSPEPTAHTQELYAALDPVVQAVLTDQNADIDALLDATPTRRSRPLLDQARAASLITRPRHRRGSSRHGPRGWPSPGPTSWSSHERHGMRSD